MQRTLKRILLFSAAPLVVAAAVYGHRTELELRYARHCFPAGWAPSPSGWSAGEIRVVSAGRNAVQVGDVQLSTGEKVAYWFLSHHQTGDLGGTLFERPDGSTRFVEGYFCCEVMFLDESALTDRRTFEQALDAMDGVSP
jgi:hypothetical protein